jgi:hypothetical protein
MATFSPHICFYCTHQLSYLSLFKVFFSERKPTINSPTLRANHLDERASYRAANMLKLL